MAEWAEINWGVQLLQSLLDDDYFWLLVITCVTSFPAQLK